MIMEKSDKSAWGLMSFSTGTHEPALRGRSGMVRKQQTRNLEIPGSMLRIAPE